VEGEAQSHPTLAGLLALEARPLPVKLVSAQADPASQKWVRRSPLHSPTRDLLSRFFLPDCQIFSSKFYGFRAFASRPSVRISALFRICLSCLARFPMILGLDPGAHGAIALLTDAGDLLSVEDMPSTTEANGKVATNAPLLAAILLALTRGNVSRICICTTPFTSPRTVSLTALLDVVAEQLGCRHGRRTRARRALYGRC
jgi:hypothetical protein